MAKLMIISIFFLLTGCSSIWLGKSYISKQRIELDIARLRSEQLTSLSLQENKIKNELGSIISGKVAQMQKVANSLYSADIAFGFYKESTRLDNIIHNRVLESSAAIGLAPTLEAIKEENTRLKVELDENLTSIEQLRATHEAKLKENSELVAATKLHEIKVAELEKEKIEIKDKFTEQINARQEELNGVNNKLLAKEKENGESKKYIEANKRLLMSAAGILAVAALAGCIFSPVFKAELGYFAGIMGAVTIAIPFIQPLHIIIGLVIVIIYVIFKIERKSAISLKTNNNLINTIDEVRTHEPEVYEKSIKTRLKDWNSKYKKIKGQIIKVKDEAVEKYIEGKLIEKEKI